METIALTENNISDIHSLYDDFVKVAMQDFLFELPPLSFSEFSINFKKNYIKAYYCKEQEVLGFLLYSDNLTQSIEITLIFSKYKENYNEIAKILLQKFIKDAKKNYKGKTISFPTLGIQNIFSNSIIELGFTPIEESILELDLTKPATTNFEIESENHYSLKPWQPEYFDIASEIIFNEFSKSNDAKFDTRFSTLSGVKQVLECITDSYYGNFLANATTVLMYNNIPVGFSFINLTTPEIANIPILVISKEHQNKGLAKKLLYNSISKVIYAKNNNQLNTKIINTTCDTNNTNAFLTYKKLGFIEKNKYNHLYKKV